MCFLDRLLLSTAFFWGLTCFSLAIFSRDLAFVTDGFAVLLLGAIFQQCFRIAKIVFWVFRLIHAIDDDDLESRRQIKARLASQMLAEAGDQSFTRGS